jgi:peptide/nickel transport system ATP-binding protein
VKLRAKGLGKVHGNGFRAVGPVDFVVAEGECVAVVGRSGAGKSTLARCLAGLERATEGTVEREGVVQLVFQDSPTALNPRWTVEELVGEAGRIAGRRVDVEALLRRVGLDGTVMGRRPGELSGGQRQRVALARALAAEGTRFLLLDEPMAGLDQEAAEGMEALLRGLLEGGVGLVYISHDLARVRELAGRVVVMAGGRVVEERETGAFFAGPASAEGRALVEAMLP